MILLADHSLVPKFLNLAGTFLIIIYFSLVSYFPLFIVHIDLLVNLLYAFYYHEYFSSSGWFRLVFFPIQCILNWSYFFDGVTKVISRQHLHHVRLLCELHFQLNYIWDFACTYMYTRLSVYSKANNGRSKTFLTLPGTLSDNGWYWPIYCRYLAVDRTEYKES